MKAGWTKKRIADVCTIVNGGTPKTGVTEYWGGPHAWITPAEMGGRSTPYMANTNRTITDAGLANSSARMLPPESVILSSRAPIGHLVINEIQMATNQGCKGLIPGKELSHKFLYYDLFSIVDLLNEMGTGATFKELSGGKLKEVQIPIPPLPEQHRIVKILDEAFENIATAKANAEKNLQNARALFESHLDSIFSNLAQECSNEDTLENLTEVGSPITYGVVKPGGKGEVIFVRGGDIAGGKVLIEQLRTIEKAVSQQYQRTLLRGGELLISLVGQPGQVAIAPQELSGANIARQVGLVRLNSRMNAEFVRYYLQSPSGKKSLHARQSGSVQQVINLGELRVVRVPVPSIDTQNKIVVDIGSSENETRRLESIYQAKIATLDELKKSLLHQAFNGDL
ncbi:MAG TPA: restriction endonuclease subunit S [Myxococcota bacterium]|nr:restriction endonuclease subunit S [Myxococcota bacterium]